MNALILPGMSPRHQEWVRQVAAVMQAHCDEVRWVEYAHWLNGGEMDLEAEIMAANDKAVGLNDYVIIAKSIGTVMATLGIARGTLSPTRCVFMGFPLKVTHDLPQADELAAALPGLPPTAFVHNQNDPIGSAEATREYIAVRAPADYEFIVTPGDTHTYVDFDQMVQLALARY